MVSDAGQAHETAAAIIARTAADHGGGRIQDFKRVLAGLRGRQQALGIGALGRGDGGFGRIGQRARYVPIHGDLTAFADHDGHAVFHLQGDGGAEAVTTSLPAGTLLP